MSMVHVSYGRNTPASPELLSEVAIVSRMAEATLGAGEGQGRHGLRWPAWRNDYSLIRDEIEKVFDDFHDYNQRIAVPGGFHLTVAPRHRTWHTASGKAQFAVHAVPRDTPISRARQQHGERLLVMMTTRSHDQYNTTIYALDDRYRGVFGMRRVIFIHPGDIAMLGMQAGEWVDVRSIWDDDVERRADGFMLVAYDIPRGCVAAYYPETNALVPLDSVADGAGTPTSKSIPVLLFPGHVPEEGGR